MDCNIYGFDYAKIIAASFLVFHHYQQVFECHFSGINFYGGKIGFGLLVELFFTISGFLTLHSEKKQMSNSGGQRLLHKISRVYPMAFLSILVCLLLKTGIQIVSEGQLTELWNLKTLVANFCLLFAGYPYFGMLGINNPVWYICILVQCYIMYYLIEWLLNRVSTNEINTIRVCVYTFVIIASFGTFYLGFLNEASFRGITSFSIGVLICLGNNFLSEKSIINYNNRKYTGLISFVLTVVLCGVVFLGLNQRWVLQFLVFPVFVFGLINFNIKSPKEMSQLGDISFDVYVFHYPLMVLIQFISEITGFHIIHSYFTMILFLVFVWIFAWLMWKLLDLPLRRKMRELEKRYE